MSEPPRGPRRPQPRVPAASDSALTSCIGSASREWPRLAQMCRMAYVNALLVLFGAGLVIFGLARDRISAPLDFHDHRPDGGR